MTVNDLVNRAYMQVGDTSQVNFTPYQFLEFYNEGNHILHRIVAKYLPSYIKKTETQTVNKSITLTEYFNKILRVLLNGELTDDYTIDGNTTIIFPDDKEKETTVEYIASAGYKELDDESGYPAEIESMLVNYMVARILKADLSFVSGWESEVSEMARQLDTDGSIVTRGYWPYDSRQSDYDD